MHSTTMDWGPEVFRLIDERLGRNLRERRKELSVSEQRMAEFLGMPRALYAQYEAGELSIPVDKLYEATLFLEVSVDSLYHDIRECLSSLRPEQPGPFGRPGRPGQPRANGGG